MTQFHPLKCLEFLLSLRTHVVALYILVYFIVCARIDSAVSATELACGLGFAALLQLAYLVNKLYDRTEDAFNGEPAFFEGPRRDAWRAGFTAAFAAVSCWLALLRPALLPVLVYSAAVTFAYSHPLVRLKGTLLLKPLINTLNFFLVAVMSPFLISDGGAWAYSPQLLAGSGRLIGMVLCLTLLFDVRDLRGDSLAGVRTVPGVLGRAPVIAAIASLSLFFAGADLLRQTYLAGANQLVIAGFALGALRARDRRYYDALVLIELGFLGLMLHG